MHTQADFQKSTYRFGAFSDRGMERDYQEDNLLLAPDLANNEWTYHSNAFQPGEWGGLLVVADGMGGLNAGEVASRLAVEGIQDFFINLDKQVAPSQQDTRAILERALLHANDRIVQHAKLNPETEGMGTTLTLAWVRNNQLHVCWSGDSRCYLLPQNGSIRQVSKDHSLVQELLDKKQITEEEAFYHPKKNIITQSLGDHNNPPKPDYKQVQIGTGDRILLCSDGLNTMLTDEQIVTLLRQGDVQECCKNLTQAANDAGGYDNITVVICEVEYAPGGAQAFDAPATFAGKKTMRLSPVMLGLLGLLVLLTAALAYLIWPDTKSDGPYEAETIPDSVENSLRENPQFRKHDNSGTIFSTGSTPNSSQVDTDKKNLEAPKGNNRPRLDANTIRDQTNDQQSTAETPKEPQWATEAKKSLENIKDATFKEKLNKIIDENRNDECEAYKKLKATGQSSIELIKLLASWKTKCADIDTSTEQKKK